MYDWRLPIDHTPSGGTFRIFAPARKRRSAEFIPPSRVFRAAETRDVMVGRVQIKGTNGDFHLDPSKSRTNSMCEFRKNNESFNFAIKLLM